MTSAAPASPRPVLLREPTPRRVGVRAARLRRLLDPHARRAGAWVSAVVGVAVPDDRGDGPTRVLRPELVVVRAPLPVDGRLRRLPDLAVLLRDDLPGHEAQAAPLLEAGVPVVWVLGRTTATVVTPVRGRRLRPTSSLSASSVPRLRFPVAEALGLGAVRGVRS